MFGPPSPLGERLEDMGADVLVPPRPFSAAARLVVGAAPVTGWIVGAPEELECLDRERSTSRVVDGAIAWCMSSALAERARERGWSRVVDLGGSGADTDVVEALTKSLTADGSSNA